MFLQQLIHITTEKIKPTLEKWKKVNCNATAQLNLFVFLKNNQQNNTNLPALNGFNLTGLNLKKHQFKQLNLTNVDFSQCNLSFSEFNHCQLTNAKFMGANLLASNWHDCNLTHVDLTNSNQQHSKWQNCQLPTTINNEQTLLNKPIFTDYKTQHPLATKLPDHHPKAKLLCPHSFTVTAVTFSPDGKFIASASIDNSVKIWDLATTTLSASIISLPKKQWLSGKHTDDKTLDNIRYSENATDYIGIVTPDEDGNMRRFLAETAQELKKSRIKI